MESSSLSLFFTASQSGATASKPLPPPTLEGSETADVVVIGAGISGLSTAYHLRQLNPNLKVIVLEARPRIGGRILTHPINPSSQVVDLGAAWVHGINNPIFKNHSTFGLQLKAFKPSPSKGLENFVQMDGIVTFDRDGQILPGKEVNEIRKRFDSLVSEMKEYGADLRAKYYKEKPMKSNVHPRRLKSCCQTSRWWEDESVRSFYDRTLEKSLKEWMKEFEMRKFPLSEEQVRDVIKLRRMLTESWYAGKEKSLSVAWLEDEIEESPTGGDHAVVNGYSTLISYLTDPPLDIRLNSPVENIIALDEPFHGYGVQIMTSSSMFLCKQTVVTLPLGVLKKSSTDLFSPPLPLWKQEAIETLGFGVLDKVVLKFQSNFWGTGIQWITVAPPETQSLLEGKVASNASPEKLADPITKDHICYFRNEATESNPILTAYVGPSAAERMEKKIESEEKIIEKALDDLARCYGKKVYSEFRGGKVIRWQNDPYARGSYSFIAVGATGEDYDAMARPVGNILFAGEATSRKSPATVHGAYRSGIREARRVVDIREGKVRSAGEPGKKEKKKKFEYQCKCKL